MKTKRISKASVIEWLKRIFTLQTLAVIVGFIAALYAVKSYKDNRLSKISMEYWTNDKKIIKNVDNIVRFENLICPYERMVKLDGYGYPMLVNKSSKSVNNLQLTIEVNYERLGFFDKDISSDYSVIEHNTVTRTIKLRYNPTILNAKSVIPFPIGKMYLPDTIPIQKDECFSVHFQYKFTYDGMPGNPRLFMPIVFYITDHVYFDNKDQLHSDDEHVDAFLTQCYQMGYLTEYRKYLVAAICDIDDFQMVKPPKRLNDAKFEKFKKEFIESRK